MFQRVVVVITLVCFAIFESGCYTIKPASPQEVRPEWDVVGVTLTNGRTVMFDEATTIEGRTITGRIRNDFDEMKAHTYSLDSVLSVQVRRPDTSTRSLIIAGVGVGLVAFFVIAYATQHRSKKDFSNPPQPSDTLGITSIPVAH